MKKIGIVGFFVIVFDQVIKYLINNCLDLFYHINIINNFFYITNVHNTGAAWNILDGNRFFLIFIALIAILSIYLLFIKNKELNKLDIISYGLLIGGIIGNLIDRIIYGYVIDYLEFILINYNYPIFNFADICIVVSVIGIVIKSIWEDVCKSSKLKKKQDA